MGKVAFVFPGQGAQAVGMGKAVSESCSAAKDVFRAADEALGESLSTLCFEGPEDQLKLTANTQPALLATSIALLRAFDETPDVVAGHSLGEYSANVAVGALPLETAIKIVRLRGTFMQEAVPVGQGAMAAVIGGDLAEIERVLAETDGVDPANYNAPGQLVIAGEASAVAAVFEPLSALGCKVKPLAVSAPFHCRLMQPAEERLTPHLREAVFSEPSAPVYVNVDAAPYTDPDALRDALIRQVSRPVRWQESVCRMRDDGVELCVEIGPGKVLAGIIKRIDRSIRSVNVQTPDDFAAAKQAIREARGG